MFSRSNFHLHFFWTDNIHSFVECNSHVNELVSHLFTGHVLNAWTFTDNILRHAYTCAKAHWSSPMVNPYLYKSTTHSTIMIWRPMLPLKKLQSFIFITYSFSAWILLFGWPNGIQTAQNQQKTSTKLVSHFTASTPLANHNNGLTYSWGHHRSLQSSILVWPYWDGWLSVGRRTIWVTSHSHSPTFNHTWDSNKSIVDWVIINGDSEYGHYSCLFRWTKSLDWSKNWQINWWTVDMARHNDSTENVRSITITSFYYHWIIKKTMVLSKLVYWTYM